MKCPACSVKFVRKHNCNKAETTFYISSGELTWTLPPKNKKEDKNG